VVKEKIEALRQKIANRDGLKAADIREAVNDLQQKSLKLFEAAYRKMAEKNQQQQSQSSSTDSANEKPSEEEEKKKEGGQQ
jgi:molecular chaperone DnaK